jgi:ferric-dicitrate binding protein FerR (iron transport regulator)
VSQLLARFRGVQWHRPLAGGLLSSVQGRGPSVFTKRHQEDIIMKRALVAGTLALVVALSVGMAAAADMQGTVKTIETQQRILTLEDGTKLYWTESVTVTEAVQSGAMVKATYEEKDGRMMLTKIEVIR